MSLQNFTIQKKKGDVLFIEHEPGNTMFFINTGSVRLSKILNDRNKTLTILKRGSFFGEMSIIKSLPRTATCTLEEDSSLLELDRKSFFTLVQRQPIFGINMLKIFAQRIADQHRKLKIISRPTVETKVLDTFLMQHEVGNSRLLGNDSYEIEITEEEIADLAGISNEECLPIIESLIISNKIKRPTPGKYILDNIQMLRSIIDRHTD